MSTIRCQGCGAKLLCQRKGELTLKAGMVKFDVGGQAVARCYASGCGVDTPIVGLAYEEQEAPRRRVHVRRRVDTSAKT